MGGISFALGWRGGGELGLGVWRRVEYLQVLEVWLNKNKTFYKLEN